MHNELTNRNIFTLPLATIKSIKLTYFLNNLLQLLYCSLWLVSHNVLAFLLMTLNNTGWIKGQMINSNRTSKLAINLSCKKKRRFKVIAEFQCLSQREDGFLQNSAWCREKVYCSFAKSKCLKLSMIVRIKVNF